MPFESFFMLIGNLVRTMVLKSMVKKLLVVFHHSILKKKTTTTKTNKQTKKKTEMKLILNAPRILKETSQS